MKNVRKIRRETRREFMHISKIYVYPFEEGYFLSCLCEGKGKGVWKCDPLPSCKVIIQGQRQNKPVGTIWSENNKKCKCISRNNQKCITESDVTNLKVKVNQVRDRQFLVITRSICVGVIAKNLKMPISEPGNSRIWRRCSIGMWIRVESENCFNLVSPKR